MSDQTFDALLEAYQERGKRVVELERLCRDIYADISDISTQEGYEGLKPVADRWAIGMRSLGLLEEE